MRRRTVLVTGGAKRIGAAVVRQLAKEGHQVVIHYRTSQAEAAELAATVGAVTVQADLTDMTEAGALVAAARRAASEPIDGLVNSASAFEFDRPPEIDPALFARLAAINAGTPAALACALAEQVDVHDGAVVNILDQKLANPNPDFFSYTCAKAALAEATVMMAQALGPRIAVNAVAPGLTLPSGDQTETEFANVAADNLLRQPVGAYRVAEAVAYLIGSRSVRGQTLFVDGGQRFVRRDRDVMFARERAHG